MKLKSYFSGSVEAATELARLSTTASGAQDRLAQDITDLKREIERLAQSLRGVKLLFTGLDETDRYGALVSEAARRPLPISFLTNGQQIPEDIEAASKARLKELILGVETLGTEPRGSEPPGAELALRSAGMSA